MDSRLLRKENYVYSKPINVYWESTIACDLVCQHCRAEAQKEPSPFQLNFNEVKKLFLDIKELESRVIITGGDPLKREDLFEIIDFANEIQLPLGITPSTTPTINREIIKKFKEKKIFFMGISIDGGKRETHDKFRGVEGTFEIAMNTLKWASEFKIPVQVNTTVCKNTMEELNDILNLLLQYTDSVRRWSLFFLINVGRGENLKECEKEDFDRIFSFIYERNLNSPFQITTTEAPHYRKIFFEKESNIDEIFTKSKKFGLGVRDGNGVIFVSHTGEIYPSGFLPISLGNVRKDRLSFVYTHNDILQKFRDSNNLKGKCGVCEYRFICGGSRARAYANSKDPFDEDPSCSHEPKRK